jgi:hypothetical protein
MEEGFVEGGTEVLLIKNVKWDVWAKNNAHEDLPMCEFICDSVAVNISVTMTVSESVKPWWSDH